MNEYHWQQFSNVGYVMTKFTENELLPVKNEIKKIQNDFSLGQPKNQELVGHIKKEYSLIDSRQYLENLLLPYVSNYEKHFNYISSITPLEKNVPLRLTNLWVNFQKKTEFNPPHNHSGVLSFVIWIKVPYDIQDEYDVFPDCRSKSTGCFNFLYANSLGKIAIKKIEADRKMENFAILFPAEMFHFVNPFYTSDDYRISISGNFKLTIE